MPSLREDLWRSVMSAELIHHNQVSFEHKKIQNTWLASTPPSLYLKGNNCGFKNVLGVHWVS